MHMQYTHSFNMYIHTALVMLLLIYMYSVLLSNSLIIIGKVGAKYVTKGGTEGGKVVKQTVRVAMRLKLKF